jgi:hypothetical protein
VGAPSGWDEGRRRELRAELDGAFFHLYGLKRDEVEWVLKTFHLIDEEIKAGVLAAYDAQQRAREEDYMPRVEQVRRTVEVVRTVTAPPDPPATRPAASAAEPRMIEAIGRLVVAGLGAPQVSGLKTTWTLGGWVVEVDWSGAEKVRAKAAHEGREEERGRAFALEASDLPDQLIAFLRGLG